MDPKSARRSNRAPSRTPTPHSACSTQERPSRWGVPRLMMGSSKPFNDWLKIAVASPRKNRYRNRAICLLILLSLEFSDRTHCLHPHITIGVISRQTLERWQRRLVRMVGQYVDGSHAHALVFFMVQTVQQRLANFRVPFHSLYRLQRIQTNTGIGIILNCVE